MNKNEKIIKLQKRAAVQSVLLVIIISIITIFSLAFVYNKGYNTGYKMATIKITNDSTKYIPIFIPFENQ